jgi:hypothetical protein
VNTLAGAVDTGADDVDPPPPPPQDASTKAVMVSNAVTRANGLLANLI